MSHDATIRFRRHLPVVEKYAYFDHAAVAPLPDTTRDVIAAYAADLAAQGDADWFRWRKYVDACRAQAATMINANEAEISLIRSTTEGITLVAEGFPWRAGDNVVLPDCEFPSNRYPWVNLASRGVECRFVQAQNERFELTDLLAQIDDRTRIVSISWVGFATGWRSDLAAITDEVHRRGALLFVDAIQGLGVLPLDVQATEIDFLSADGHKWMLAPEGAGIFWCRREHLELLRPLGVGWNSVRHAGDYDNTAFDLRDDAARYEGGTYNIVGFCGLAESLSLLNEIGVENISNNLRAFTEELCDVLGTLGGEIASDRSEGRWSGIVSCAFANKDPHAIKRKLLAGGVVANCRGGRVRFSPHGYANQDDLAKLTDVLKHALATA